MELVNKVCNTASEWCDHVNTLLDNWQIKSSIALFFSFFFGDIYAPVMIVIGAVLVDLFSKWNAIAYLARQKYAPNSKWPLIGFIAAIRYDMIDDEPMRTKFWPKCKRYFFMMMGAGVLLKVFKAFNAQNFNEIAYAIMIYIFLIEVKSIGRNLKEARNPLHRLFTWVVDMYYRRKGGYNVIPTIPSGPFFDQEKDLPVPPDKEPRL